MHNVEDGGELGNNNYKPNIQVYRLDLGSTSCIRECARNIAKNETKIDILINNAGTCIKDNNILVHRNTRNQHLRHNNLLF